MKIHGQQGYTLIEMLLVLMLTAMVALSGGHACHRYRQHAQLEQATTQITDFLLRWQLAASRGNHSCQLSVTRGGNWSITAYLMPAAGMPPVLLGRLDSPSDDIRLDFSQFDYLTLAGTRNTATAGHLTVCNAAGRLKIILSGKGRVRICSERGRWPGVASC
ncbi:prepilin-type N-terminal cleavage/methylation domain-containing protein [Acerihabitans sp. TG2]|uniref:prepilin-type N-terminal cleavage/methylation domain-containing protein n=1 Tax=Acerihabitans sp. TG2 TaxID=3096008 RepID=UPI002B227AA2|nr:prepilin-type N-terminal cleavage/methylation domain-containing protein [Acerihabitans sp. TG2]MEA9392514.1 prepilin-type N-terminal cleavage/methylation domain-containing protein [Acerihabitans sp. TG2]